MESQKFLISSPSKILRLGECSPWLIWGLGAAFFFIEYYARVAPSVMANELMQAFNVNAFALGSLSAFFYYAYIVMQMPVGMLMDKYGTRQLLTYTALICGFAAFGFAFSTHIFFADLCRLLMGFGASFAFIGALKIAADWFPASRFGLMSGLTQAIGMLGAATGLGLMAVIVSNVGWRHTMMLIGIIFIILAVAIYLIVRDAPFTSNKINEVKPKHNLLTTLRIVIKNPQSWINAAYAGFIYAPTAAFAELWGVPFLQQAYNISVTTAATAVSLIFIGWGIGGPVTGFFSDSVGLRKPYMYASAICGFIAISLVLYVQLPIYLIYILLFFYGMTNTGVSISYAVASEINPKHTAGTSMALTNMASVIVGATFQPVIGFLLVLHWSGVSMHGVPYYTVSDYHSALLLLPFCSLIGLFLAFFVKESYGKEI